MSDCMVGLLTIGGIVIISLCLMALWWGMSCCAYRQPAPPAKRKKTREERQIAELKDWKPIGSQIRYLGLDMIVTGHSRADVCGYSIYQHPCLRVDYVDKAGMLQQASFAYEEAKAMMASSGKPKRPKGKARA